MKKEDALSSIVEYQSGYFTVRRALQAGYFSRDQHYHKANGNWTQVELAIYRLKNYSYPNEMAW